MQVESLVKEADLTPNRLYVNLSRRVSNHEWDVYSISI